MKMKSDWVHVFVVFRLELLVAPHEQNHITIKSVHHEKEDAIAEVSRLNGIAKEGAVYLWQSAKMRANK